VTLLSHDFILSSLYHYYCKILTATLSRLWLHCVSSRSLLRRSFATNWFHTLLHLLWTYSIQCLDVFYELRKEKKIRNKSWKLRVSCMACSYFAKLFHEKNENISHRKSPCIFDPIVIQIFFSLMNWISILILNEHNVISSNHDDFTWF
jgi:dolichol kinase